MLNFIREDGITPARDFKSCKEMDIAMAVNWKNRVGRYDRIYHLGDIAFTKEALLLIATLPGKKRLIRGNHDIFDTKDYLKVGFEEIHGMKVIDYFGNNIILTHAPVHPSIISEPRFAVNIHGHIHERIIPDSRYFNACVEHHEYAPIPLEYAIINSLAEQLNDKTSTHNYAISDSPGNHAR